MRIGHIYAASINQVLQISLVKAATTHLRNFSNQQIIVRLKKIRFKKSNDVDKTPKMVVVIEHKNSVEQIKSFPAPRGPHRRRNISEQETYNDLRTPAPYRTGGN